jgi:SAM-dependent methyltransferase
VSSSRDAELEALLAEQVAYYRARAPEYSQSGMIEVTKAQQNSAERALLEEVEKFGPAGDVLELACGPGTFTSLLRRHATTLTAVDASPEMLALARAKAPDARFIEADLFGWRPDRRYDVVFFGFWLSHVPLERFEPFWAMVGDALKPSGRVFFVDDAFRTEDELIEGPQSSTIRRTLRDGTAFRAVKVPHTPDELQARLEELGWSISVRPLVDPFFIGSSR